MPRKSAIAPVVSRDSFDDRQGNPATSPFRASKFATRVKAARAMITKREAEIAALEKALEKADTPKMQKMLATRLLATKNNLRSWQDYIVTAEREPRAVITPSKTR